jgi:hypothetical protein
LPPQPVLPKARRNWNAAAFSTLKKYASHFFNPAKGDTLEKEAAYPVTGKSKKRLRILSNPNPKKLQKNPQTLG